MLNWETVGPVQFIHPAIVWLFFLFTGPLIIRPAVDRLPACVQRVSLKWIGSEAVFPENRVGLNILSLIQMICSAISVVGFVAGTYIHSSHGIWQPQTYFFLVYFFVMAQKHNWKMNYFLSFEAIIDIFTITFHLLTDGGFHDLEIWLNIDFLRSYMIVSAYVELKNNRVTENLSAMTLTICEVSLRLLAMVIIFSSTILYLELMGPIPSLEEQMMETEMGEISWFTTVYWTFTTITTVGYGDFSPTTLLSRFFTIVFIVFGVVFFGNAAAQIQETRSTEASGMGSYLRKMGKPPHILILGGGVKRSSSMLTSFLSELLSSDHSQRSIDTGHFSDMPDVVLMSSHEAPTALRQLQKESWAMGKIHYYVGSPMSSHDMRRVKYDEAGMLFVLADLLPANTDSEDSENIMRALACQHFLTSKQVELGVRLGVMLLRPESRIKAMCVGVETDACFSINEVKANMVAQSCRCPGLYTMLVNFMTTDRFGFEEGDPRWMEEYMTGSSMEVYGFALCRTYTGRKFADVACEIYASQSTGPFSVRNVLLVAAQVNGKLVMNPYDHEIESEQVVFALAPSHLAISTLRHMDNSGEEFNWENKFDENRKTSGIKNDAEQQVAFDIRESEDMHIKATLAQSESSALDHGISVVVGGPRTVANEVTRECSLVAGGAAGAPVKIREALNYNSLESRLDMFLESQKENETLEVKMKAEEIEGRKLVEKGGHILVAILASNDDVWQQVAALLHPLRAEYLPCFQSVVLLAETLPHKEMLEFDQVAFLQGNPSHMRDLMKAGLDRAKCVLVLSGDNGDINEDSPEKSSMLGDAQAIIAGSALELVVKRPFGAGFGEVFTMIELGHAETVNLLKQPTWDVDLQKTMYNMDGKETDDSESSKMCGSRSVHTFIKGPAFDAGGTDSRPGEKEFCTHPRFTAGQVFTPNLLGSLFAMSYWTPGIMEFFQALVRPSRSGQDSFLWLAAVPAQFTERKRTYLELLTHCIKENGKCLVGEPEGWQLLGSPMPLGLYRPRGCNQAPLPYVFTNPYPELELYPGDSVYVVASKEWGQALHRWDMMQAENPANFDSTLRSAGGATTMEVEVDMCGNLTDNSPKASRGCFG